MYYVYVCVCIICMCIYRVFQKELYNFEIYIYVYIYIYIGELYTLLYQINLRGEKLYSANFISLCSERFKLQ